MKKKTDESIEKIVSGINSNVADEISKESKELISKRIDPWKFFNSGKFRIEKFDGKPINYSGCRFEGSSREVFWGYIKPFLEEFIEKKIKDSIKIARDKKVPVKDVLYSTDQNLDGVIDHVYTVMQNVDQRLRGCGNPDSVQKKDVSALVERMRGYLGSKVKTYLTMETEIYESGFKRWYARNPHVLWLIGIALSIAAILISVFS